MLVWFFTAVYFLIFFFFISVGLGEFTVKKIKENYSNK